MGNETDTNPDNSSLVQGDMADLVRAMLEQNRLREQQMEQIITKLMCNQRTTTPMMLPNLTKTIPMFNGETGDTDAAAEWLNALKTAAQLNGWPDESTLEARSSYLEGAARNWYLSHMGELNTFEKFAISFEAMFMAPEGVTETWRRMYERVQQKNETVFAYFHDKVRMFRRLKLSMSETKKMICVGLHSRDMSSALMSNGHVHEEELMADIRDFYDVSLIRGERFRNTLTPGRQVPAARSTSVPNVGTDKQDATRSIPIKKEFRKTYDGPRCYNCQLTGHVARDCTQPRRPLKCTKCKLEGHTAKYCQVTNTPDVSLVSCQNKSKLMYYMKEVRINDNKKTVRGLVDTGSAFTIITKSIAKSNGLEVRPKTVNMYVYGSAQSIASCGETQAIIHVDEVSELITLVVVDDQVQQYDMIIGRSFTDCENVTFIKTSDQLQFAYGMMMPYQEGGIPCETTNKQIVRVVCENENIPANSMKMVKVNAGDHDVEVMLINDKDTEIRLNRDQSVGVIRGGQKSTENNQDVKTPITAEMVKYGSTFSKDEVDRLVQLLNQYRECFAFNLNELGCTDVLAMDIVDDGKPVMSKPYRASASERETISRIVQEWKEAGIVTETKSSYASPVLLVTKKDGDARLVVDYRKLNAQTVRKVFPTPNLDEHLETLHGATLFTTLDLASGYLQVPLTETAKEKTAFITPSESGQFERMVFGLINAPYEFSRLMQRILQPLKNRVAMWYLDDILVPSTSFQDMINRLGQVFDALREAKLTLKLSKCHFGCTEVAYLGFMLSADGVRPGDQKAIAIQQYPKPKNKHEVRRFLGLCGFFRRFIPRYAEIVRPISDLLRDNVQFEWTVPQEEAYNNLKDRLVSKPVLQVFNPNADTELHCDASSVGLSGMLLQRGEDKRLYLVHAVSKKTTSAERHYHSSKQELMAVVWSMCRLRPYLIGIKFLVVTDCQAIVHLNTQKTLNPQVARWATLLSEYNFDIKHRPGSKMDHIDALSRAPTSMSQDTETELLDEHMEVFITMTEEDQVIAMQQADVKLKAIMGILSQEESDHTTTEAERVKDYQLRHGMLYRKVTVDDNETRLLWVVPESMRKSIVVRFHDLAGHFAVDRTVSKIKEKYYFPKMRRYVKMHINCCPECVLIKTPRGRQPGELHPITPGKRPFEVINIDHIGPFVKSTKGNNYIMVLIDNLTKYVKLFPVKSCGTESVVTNLQAFVLTFGTPKRIISDRGTAFTSKAFEAFCVQYGIRHTLNSVRHPQSNGQVERVNSTLVPVMQSTMESDRTWDKRISDIECHLNNAYNKTIGGTPFHVLFGYYPSFRDGVLHHVTTNEVWDSTTLIQNRIRERISREHQQWKQRYDSKHARTIRYEVGEVVFIRRPPEATGESTKLQFKYRGPLVVTEVLPNDVYRVAGLRVEAGRRYVTVVHVSHIKGYHLPVSEEPNEDSTTTEQDEEDRPTDLPNTENIGSKQSEVKDTQSKRVRKTPAWHSSYQM